MRFAEIIIRAAEPNVQCARDSRLRPTAVSAACAGTVVSVREDDLMGYTVTVEHGNGYRSSYASLQPEIRVEEGDYVSAGEVLGAVGNSSLIESGQGAHLHFAVTHQDQPMDPAEFLALGQ